jgi:TonB family protein
MKTIKFRRGMKKRFMSGNTITLILLFSAGLLIVILPSCASRRIRKSGTETGITPPPSPPPPPNAPSSSGQNEEIPFVVVEEMPMFPGGDSALLEFITTKTVYPQDAKEKGIQGRVIVRFCVNATGSVDRVTVLKGITPELDKEAVRVISSLPKFSPGRQGGKPVPVWYMAPVSFTLDENK